MIEPQRVLQDLNARLRRSPEIKVFDRDASWQIRVHKPGRYVFEITVADEALEWYVDVHQTTTEQLVWRDWVDYRGYGNDTDAEFAVAMADDLEHFMEWLLAASAFRTVDYRGFLGRRKQRFEWRTAAGDWQ